MNKLLKLFAVVPVAAALMTPCVSWADDHDHDRDRRYYDREHKDYHHWDDREDRYYHRYWEEQHRPYIDWNRANERQRAEYWHWRHEHMDRDDRR